MCQLTLCNLGKAELNNKMYLLLGSIGSSVHKDGWGAVSGNGGYIKCEFPACDTVNMGKLVSEISTESTPLIGHIRLASAQVPVNRENAHPFVGKNIFFMHNGTLTPKIEKDFVTEIEVETKEIDDKTKVEITKTKKVKISDSKVFFQEFVKDLDTKATDLNKAFVEAINKTMEKFTGKFAFLFYFKKFEKYYVVRGKSADLHIAYLLDSSKKDAKTLGFVINTSFELLDKCCTILSNLNQMETGQPLFFTEPIILSEETIYEVEKLDINKIGEVKENTVTYAGRTAYNNWEEEGATNFSHSGVRNTTTRNFVDKEQKYAKTIYDFMMDYSLRVKDIQYLFINLYGMSLKEVNEEVVIHFTEKVIPRIKNLTTKALRKRIHNASNGLIRETFYTEKGFQYPWMLNNKTEQNTLISAIKESVKESKEKSNVGK